MPKADKFSFALKRGFNELGQASEVRKAHDGTLFATIPYIRFHKNQKGDVKISEFGFRSIGEEEIHPQRETLEKKGIEKGLCEILTQTESLFKNIHTRKLSLEEVNKDLKNKTEDFYQTYVAGETITQTYYSMGRHLIPNTPDKPEDTFKHRRWLQHIDERIGKTATIPLQQVRKTFGLE